MTFGMIARTILEFALIVFTLWAILHEDYFAALEERLIARIRRSRLKVLKGGNTTRYKRYNFSVDN